MQIYDDAEALARAAHDAILGLANECIREHGRFTLALSGGSTPRLLYSLFERQELDWSKVHLFFGDERCVSPEHAESNYRMVREALLARVSPPAENVHRILAELDPDEAAAQYEEELRRAFGLGPGELPRFDLVLLGLGADGHTASLFPGTLALEERRHLVVANNPGAGGPERVTLTYPVLNAASSIWFLVTGAEKADVAAEVVRGTGEGLALPASGVQPKDGAVIWMLDRAAASSLA